MLYSDICYNIYAIMEAFYVCSEASSSHVCVSFGLAICRCLTRRWAQQSAFETNFQA